MRIFCFTLACLIIGLGEARADEPAFFIYGSACRPSVDHKPPECRLVGWPAESGEANLLGLPWTYTVGPKSDKLLPEASTVAHATAH